MRVCEELIIINCKTLVSEFYTSVILVWNRNNNGLPVMNGLRRVKGVMSNKSEMYGRRHNMLMRSLSSGKQILADVENIPVVLLQRWEYGRFQAFYSRL